MARDSSIDIAKGIGIILVVFGHDTLCPSIIRNVIFSFHMPLFFILSGYFYKNKNFKDVIVGGVKLWKYYVVAVLIRLLILVIFQPNGISNYLPENVDDLLLAAVWANGNQFSNVIWSYCKPIDILWFLPALFWCKVVYSVCRKVRLTNTLYFLSISFIAYVISRKLINIPFGIPEGITGAIFYHLGYLLKSGLNKKVVYVSIIVWVLTCTFVKLDMAAYIYGFYPVNILQGLGGTLVVLMISNSFLKYRISHFLENAGKYSINIFIIHALLLYALLYGYNGNFYSQINTLSCMLIIVLMYIYNVFKKNQVSI